MTDFAIFSAWTGLLGGLAGFISVLIQGRALYFEKPRLKVKVSYGIYDELGEIYCLLEIINVGSKSVLIHGAGIQYKNKQHSPLSFFQTSGRSGPPFPHRIEGHSNVTWSVTQKEVESAVKKLNVGFTFKAYVNYLDKKKLSKKIKVR